MNVLKRELTAVGVLLVALVAADVRADPPDGPPKGNAPPGAGQGKGKPEPVAVDTGMPGHHGAGHGKPENPGAKGAEEAADRRGGKGHSELRGLRDELKAGKLKKEDVEGRLAKLRDNNKDRQENHRAALKARWGEHLAKADAQQELAVHERRMAKLNRLLLLAQTEKKGKDADKLSTRIDKLVELETTRHEKRMAQITGTTAATPTPPAAVNTEVTK